MPAGATGRPLAGGLTGREWRREFCQRAGMRALFLRHGCRHGGLGAPAPKIGYENMRYVAQNPRAAEPVQHNACLSDPKQAEIPFAAIASCRARGAGGTPRTFAGGPGGPHNAEGGGRSRLAAPRPKPCGTELAVGKEGVSGQDRGRASGAEEASAPARSGS